VFSEEQFFKDILANPVAKRFMLNSLSTGETEGGKDLHRVAEHCVDPELKVKVERHFRDEIKHGVLFGKHLRADGHEPTPLEPDLDYDKQLQALDFGTSVARINDPRPFDDEDWLLFFVGSKVTEETANRDMPTLRRGFETDPELLKTIDEVMEDEVRHVTYATVELQRLAAKGDRAKVNRMLWRHRRLEAKAYRIVSCAFIDRITRILGYPFYLRWVMKLACHVQYLWKQVSPGPGLEEATPASVAAATSPAPPAEAPAETPAAH